MTANERIATSTRAVNTPSSEQAQLGFGFLADIDREREREALEARYGHLPSTMPEGIALYRQMIDRHHERMMAGDVDGTMDIRREAHDLAIRLNGGTSFGICGGPDAPGRVLERDTQAADGTVPKWGQTGSFAITVGKMRVRIEQSGIFGIGSNFGYWPGFAAHAVERDMPFLSETGYRSFIGAGLIINGKVAIGVGPDGVASEVIFQHVTRELKGKLRKIVPFEPMPGQSYPLTPSP